QVSSLFASISQLSTDPSSLPLRQGVLTAAANLASAFRNTASNLEAQRSNLDLSVSQAVQQVNTLTQQIAGLNGQITSLENLHQDASAFIDQRDVLINRLSGLVDVSEIRSDSGITLTTSNGTALIAASSDGSAGSNGNLAAFSSIHDQKTIAGETPSNYYGNLVFGVGNDVANGTAELQSSQLVLQQLEDQRGSISGVSLDEEAA